MIIDYFLKVSEQVSVLFILIGIGYLCGKVGFIDKHTTKKITDIVLYVVTPCVIIHAYQMEYQPSILVNLGITALCAIGVHLLSMVIVKIVFRKMPDNKKEVLKFGSIFSNCGFMSFPLQQAILGKEGILYGAAFVGVFNLFVWSYGVVCMSGERKNFSVKKIMFNPGILGVFIALLLFLFSVKLPMVIASPVEYLANLNTPLPMLIIGYYLSQAKLTDALKDKYAWSGTVIRLIVIPMISIGIMILLHIKGITLITLAISVSAPVAATTTMFATKFDKNTALSVNLVSLSTVLSIITMSCIVAVSQIFA